MKGLFRWAKKRKHVKKDPTADSDIEAPKKKKGKGFPAWTREDIAAYQRHWPIGTRQRVWLDVLLYTGLRRGDAVRDNAFENKRHRFPTLGLRRPKTPSLYIMEGDRCLSEISVRRFRPF